MNMNLHSFTDELGHLNTQYDIDNDLFATGQSGTSVGQVQQVYSICRIVNSMWAIWELVHGWKYGSLPWVNISLTLEDSRFYGKLIWLNWLEIKQSPSATQIFLCNSYFKSNKMCLALRPSVSLQFLFLHQWLKNILRGECDLIFKYRHFMRTVVHLL